MSRLVPKPPISYQHFVSGEEKNVEKINFIIRRNQSIFNNLNINKDEYNQANFLPESVSPHMRLQLVRLRLFPAVLEENGYFPDSSSVKRPWTPVPH